MLKKDEYFFQSYCEEYQTMTDEDLQKLIELISIRCFKREFSHQTYFNSRLQTTGGRYHLNDHHIDINPKVFERYGWRELVDVIIHELCHYHLHLTKQGYQHRDKDFKDLLQATGGSRYVQPLAKQQSITKYLYQCKACSVTYTRKRRMNVSRYRCPCGGGLQSISAKM